MEKGHGREESHLPNGSQEANRKEPGPIHAPSDLPLPTKHYLPQSYYFSIHILNPSMD
jgi:hypothetical protein